MAPTLTKLNKKDSVIAQPSLDQISWLTSINEVGRIVGTIVSPLIIDNFGRKYTLVLVTVLYSVVWWSVNFAFHINTLYASRLIFGLANGIDDVVAPIYSTENCSPNFRGIIGSIVTLTFYVALFIEYIIGTYLSYTGTAIANIAMAGSVFLSLIFVTETPYFLIMKGKYEEGKKNLIWLSGNVNTTEVTDEVQRIERSVSEEKMKKRSLRLLFSSTTNVKGIIMVVSMNFLGIATGAMVFNTCSSLIFSPSETLTPNEYTIFYGAMPFVAMAISPFIIEKINRRSIVIGCCIVYTLSNICSYLLVYSQNNGFNVKYYPWLIFASISVYCIFHALSAPAGFALKGELLPLSVRAIGNSMAVIGFSISTFCTTKMFIPINENFGMQTNFLIYCIAGLVSIVFFYRVLPETKGKTLHELQNLQEAERLQLNKITDEKVEETFTFH